MNITLETKVRTKIINARTGRVIKKSKWQKNLIMDNALNALAKSTNSTYPAEMFAACRIGDGTTANSYASGAVTFTQSGTTVTASAGFFTAAMVGMIFKYGTGTSGAEYYITAFTDTTHVTVDTSATVSTPTVATVWAVNQTAMVNLLYTSAAYETSAGSCGSTFSNNVVTHKRTFNFAQQASSYNVNEIGYFRVSTGTTVFGRLLLGATDVVAPTNFYQVQLSIQFTFTPGAPAAVGNVGTNIDTTGNAMLEFMDSNTFSTVTTTGTNAPAGAGRAVDGSNAVSVQGLVATYTQNLVTGTAAPSNPTNITFQSSLSWVFNSVRGQCKVSSSATISTAGQTLYGVGLANFNGPCFDVKFTTPYSLPTGSFLPQCVFTLTFNRTLTN